MTKPAMSLCALVVSVGRSESVKKPCSTAAVWHDGNVVGSNAVVTNSWKLPVPPGAKNVAPVGNGSAGTFASAMKLNGFGTTPSQYAACVSTLLTACGVP